MNKLLLSLFFSVNLSYGFAQTNELPKSYPYSKLTLEPGIGTGLSSLMGVPNLQFYNLLQLNIGKRMNVVSHTALNYQFGNNRIEDVQQNYDYTIAQQFGIGTSFYTERSSSNFYLLAGLKYDAYSGTFQNSEMPENITTKTSSFSPAYGVMYNLKKGRNKYFFSSNLYIPLNDGVAGMVENTSLQLGLGIRIR